MKNVNNETGAPAMKGSLNAGVGRWLVCRWSYLTLWWTIWWHLRRTRRHFARVAKLPRDEAMMIVTRWRWDLVHVDVADERVREAYLIAVERLARQVEASNGRAERRAPENYEN